MTRKDRTEDRSEREELNDIADKWSANGGLPDDISMDDLVDICETLYEQLEDLIDAHVTETPLTRCEAEVWLLTNLYDEDRVLLTEEAIALVQAVSDSPFGEAQDAPANDEVAASPTVPEVEQRYERAEQKYEQAKEFVGLTTFRDRDEYLNQPKITWLSRLTIARLRDRSQPEDNTLDDTISRILEDSETRLSLEEFTHGYVDARGMENVAQVALDPLSFETGTLHFTAHTGIDDELPDVVTETDAIEIGGERHDFYFDEDPYGPHDGLGRVTLYAADNILGMEEVHLADGIETARNRLREDSEPVRAEQS